MVNTICLLSYVQYFCHGRSSTVEQLIVRFSPSERLRPPTNEKATFQIVRLHIVLAKGNTSLCQRTGSNMLRRAMR